ncbi:RDD family protein [Pedobacter frigiditerrae]|uniref:RDD family protein n=1 Tax=Pedobacter frigiditerrae TaxID=2530452 RepID=A0A4R0N128_9SPHI|nr:RDD family protein [Pedobacter frigiditerrae]TCC93380.1 RDD family protein [Pedobacter frigiditerrae]
MEFKENSLNLEYCRASMSKRFINYLIDSVVVFTVLFLMGFTLELISPGLISGSSIGGLSERIVGMIFYGTIMSFTEIASQGKSIGKLITGTRVIDEDGSSLSIGKAIIRNFIRAIPFDAFSAFGNPCKPWHDSWSHTMVVDEKLLALQVRKDVFFSALKNQTQ